MGFLVVKSARIGAPNWSEDAWIKIDDIDLMREVERPEGVCVIVHQTGTKHEIMNTSAEQIARAIHEVRTGNLPFLRI